jgi:1,2-diacylglycerol 3-alpha-glucosyltransferase
MRICMVTDSFWPRINGVTVSVSTLTRALRSLGHQVYIAAPDYGNLPGRRRFVDGDRAPFEGVFRFPAHPVLFFPEDAGVRFVSRAYHQQVRRIAALDVDVVHTHTPMALGILAMYWHRGRRVPLVHTFHTLFEDFMPHYFPFCYLPRRLRRYPIRWFSLNALHWYCNHFDRVIVPSRQVADLMGGYYLRSPVEVVPTGIEIERFQGGDGARIRREWGIGAQERLLLFSGRVCFEKNVALLMHAMPHILRADARARLAIVGQGPAEGALRRLAAELGIEQRVHLTGYRPYAEMADIYAAADLFLLASQTETQGLVTVEAMASGTPVVAVRGPGTLDVLADEQGGLLCAPQAEDIAAKALDLLNDPAAYARKAAQARRRAEAFSARAMARRMVEVYESVLSPVGAVL